LDHDRYTRDDYRAAAEAIRSHTDQLPRLGLILGSGLNPLANEVDEAVKVPYSQIPGFAQPSIPGHEGQLVFGRLAGKSVCIMQGRVHAYEGWGWDVVTFPIRVMHELGINTLIVTNAAGGVNPRFKAGDLMLIEDHIGLAALTGQNPLMGPNDESLGPRFLDMSKSYDRSLRELTLAVSERLGIFLHRGVYAGLSGPAFETPAEIRFLRAIGADATGMSTVPEVMVARHMGMRVLGISGISNATIDVMDSDRDVDHAEVLAAGKTLVPRLMALLRGVLAEMRDE
jgi:purine-nucleoside phosphorylase